jgi:hypothetical protein
LGDPGLRVHFQVFEFGQVVRGALGVVVGRHLLLHRGGLAGDAGVPEFRPGEGRRQGIVEFAYGFQIVVGKVLLAPSRRS